jgi:S-adenosylmethionine:tRNA ribosyltransferase-isomerase
VRVDDVRQHRMEAEWSEIPEATAAAIAAAKSEGRRVIAVGTTTTRALESSCQRHGEVRAGCGWAVGFIVPGFEFRVVDGLLTNFHLPRSTLFMLVSAFCGLEVMKRAYAHAIAEGYRFYSYGDACLLFRP